jgi:putative transposase
VLEVYQQLWVSLATFYVWKRSMGQMVIREFNELRVLRDENGKLKKLVTNLTLDKHILQEILSKKV